MFVRFQFRSTTFAELVRDKLAKSDVGAIPPTSTGFVVTQVEFPGAGPDPLDVKASILDAVLAASAARVAPHDARVADLPRLAPGVLDLFDLDHVDVPVAGGDPVRLFTRRVLLTLPITLHVQTVNDLIAGTGTPTVFTIDVRLALSLQHHDGKDFLRVAYDGLGHHEGTDPGLEALVATELSGATNLSREEPFDYADMVLTAVASMGGSGSTPPVVCWSGLTLAPDRQTIELRLELTFDDPSGTHDLESWRSFYDRRIDGIRGDHDWAVAISDDLLRRSIHDGLAGDLAANSDFNLESDINVSWHPERPGFGISFSGEAVDACYCFFSEIDVNVDVSVNADISLPVTGTNPQLQVDTHLTTDETNGWEEACCFITGALAWPIVGTIYLADGKVGWGGYLVGMLTGVVGGALAMIEWFHVPGQAARQDCVKDGNDENHQICTYGISLNPPNDPCNANGAGLSLQQVFGRPDALVLAGTADQVHLAPPDVTVAPPQPFTWVSPTVTCDGTAGQWHGYARTTVAQDGGQYPLIVKDVRVVGGNAAIYTPAIESGTTCPTTATIGVDTAPNWPFGDPGYCTLLVITNVGTKLAKLGPLPKLDDHQVEEFNLRAPIIRVTKCDLLVDPWWKRFHRLNPKWLVDPPPGDLVGEQLWGIRAGGLEQGELIVVRDAQERVLATGIADRRKGLQIDLLHAGDEIFLERQPGQADVSGEGEAYGLQLRQALLLEVGRHDFGAPVDRIENVGDGSVRAVAGTHSVTVPFDPVTGFDGGSHRPVLRAPQRTAVVAADERAGADLDGELARNVTLAVRSGLLPTAAVAAAPAMRSVQRSAPGRSAVVGLDGGLHLEVSARLGPRGAYAERPWSDSLVRHGATFFRLTDDHRALRAFRIHASEIR